MPRPPLFGICNSEAPIVGFAIRNNIFDAMAFAYVVKNQERVHFVTFTVHQWVDVFTRQIYVNELCSLKFCQQEKGLEIFAWVIMSNQAILSREQLGITD